MTPFLLGFDQGQALEGLVMKMNKTLRDPSLRVLS
jgi:hypothetical protein